MLGVTYPLCEAKSYPGHFSCNSTMIRSRVTLAMTDAAAMHAATRSPFHIARPGTPRPAIGKPSVRTYPGVSSRRANARRIASTLVTCRPRRSTSSGGTMTTDHATARATTASYTCSRTRGVSSLESARSGISARRLVASTAAATTSGPAHAPRPASSAPATGARPMRSRARS